MAYSKKEKTKIINAACERVSNGEAIRNVLKDDNMPGTEAFFNWIKEDESKSKQYACACALRADAIFDEMLDIADAYEKDVSKDKDGIEQVNYNIINRDRLRNDTRKFIVARLNPKKYGDTTRHKHSGDEDDDTPIKIIGTIIK